MGIREEVGAALAHLLGQYAATAPPSPTRQDMVVIPSNSSLLDAFQVRLAANMA
jgi:hypothetical protein